jgi:hypothetical protein
MTKHRFHCRPIAAVTVALAILAAGPMAGHRSLALLADAQSEAGAWSGFARSKSAVVLADSKTERDAWQDIKV